MLLSLVACGTPSDTTKAPSTTKAPDTDDDPKIDTGIPDDLDFSNASNNTVTFFVRTHWISS